MKTKYTVGINELESLAEELIATFSNRKVWAFMGEVGAGKTTLIKSILKKLGYLKTVDSPTFSLVNTYETDFAIIHHFDFYRLNSYAELLQMGWEEYLHSNARIFIEWPEIVPEALSDDMLVLKIVKPEDEGKRDISIVNG